MVEASKNTGSDRTLPGGNLEEERLRLARMLVEALSPESREALLRTLSPNPVDRIEEVSTPTGVLSRILRLVPTGSEVTAASLRRKVADFGVEAEPKEVYNSIGYLARAGALRRVGYGRYVVNGVEFSTSDNFGGEPDRLEDLSDDG